MKKKPSKLSATMLSRDKRQSNVGFVMTEPRRDARPAAARPEERDGTAASPAPSSAPSSAHEPAAAGKAGSAVPSIRAFNAGLAAAAAPKTAGAPAADEPPPDERTGEDRQGDRQDATAAAPPANVLPFQAPTPGPAIPPEADPAAGLAKTRRASLLGGPARDWRDQPLAPGDAAQALVQALRAADLTLAETLFGDLTGLSSSDVLRVLYAPGGDDLALACRALGLEQLQFVSIFIMTRKLGLGEEALDPKELARIVGLFEVTDPADADQALASWRS